MGMKEAYQEKADAQLREWKTWIENYKSDGAKLNFIGTSEQQRTIMRLEKCFRTAWGKLDELRFSQEERWEFAKQAVERAMIEFKQALDESGVGQSGSFLPLQPSRAHMYEPFQRRG